MPIPETPAQEWSRHLDALEADLGTSERTLRGEVLHQESLHGQASFEEALAVAWTAPAVQGPMPAAMLPRAQELHRRQRALAAQVLRALRATSGHRAYVDIAERDQLSVPRFVDLVG